MTDEKKDPPLEAEQAPTEEESRDNTRRGTLRKLLTGSGILITASSLPKEWTRPIIDTVILPAHATSSLVDPCLITIISSNSSSVVARMTGYVNPPTKGVTVAVTLELLNSSNVVVATVGPFNVVTDSAGQYDTGNQTLNGANGTTVRGRSQINGVDSAACSQTITVSRTTATTTPAPTTATSTTATSTTATSTTATTTPFV